jgi:hypothetical protein
MAALRFLLLAALTNAFAPAKNLSELHVRDALPNAFAKASVVGEVRAAFLGGSITAAYVCLVYAVSQSLLKNLCVGDYQSTARLMENIAARHGLPSFNFGVEVARRVTASTLVTPAPATASAAPTGSRQEFDFVENNSYPLTRSSANLHVWQLALRSHGHRTAPSASPTSPPIFTCWAASSPRKRSPSTSTGAWRTPSIPTLCPTPAT